MRKILSVLAIVLLLNIIGITACNMKEEVGIDTEQPVSELTGDEILKTIIVDIPDESLEREIREATNKPTGDLTAYDLSRIVELDLRNKGIVELTGLEYTTNLTKLNS